MQLAIASHDLYPDPGSGGTGRYVYETGRRLVDRGHDVSVLTRRRGDVPRTETVAGIDVCRYDLSVAETSAPAILRQLPDAASAAARSLPDDPDVLSLQGPVTGALAHASTDDDVPRRCTFHSPWPTEYDIRTRESGRSVLRRRFNVGLRDVIEAGVLSGVDEIGTLSEFMLDRLRERHDPDVPTTVVPGGVDAAVFTPDAAPTAAGGPTFLSVRRLSPRMGHSMLLSAFATVTERHPDAKLLLAGDGPLADRLRTEAAELGIADATHFLGYVPDEDLPATYASADVFVLPTTELEGFGLATLEALASGTPVVGTPVGGTVELLEGCRTGDDVPVGMLATGVDADALATRMLAWGELDPEVRARAGHACRAYAKEQYTWERTVDAIERRYLALAES